MGGKEKNTLRVAIVHDWIDGYRGGERVLDELANLYPDAPIYTLFYNPAAVPQSLSQRDIRFPATLNRFRRFRKWLLPILPSAVESLKLMEFDLIISTSSCVAKGIIPHPSAKHICYIHSPMRYVWDQQAHYLGGVERLPIVGGMVRFLAMNLRLWDTVTAVRVDKFLANSNFVQSRVSRYYGRESIVVHPPVDLDRFLNLPKSVQARPYFLVAGPAVPYKRIDLAISACERLGRRLIVAGDGSLFKKWRKISGKNTEFVIGPSEQQFAELLAGADALLYPGIEDFGILPIEAMACGTPVIALKAGGALDYIVPDVNGIFFATQTVDALVGALEAFQVNQFVPTTIRETTAKFSRQEFVGKVRREIAELLKDVSL
jgi:glycosyltransferase involved in cell wall biosynthesis